MELLLTSNMDMAISDLSTTLHKAKSITKAVGRPVFDGKDENEVVAKLQYAFSIGAQVKEACNLADISTNSFYRYCKKYPEFRNKIDRLQTTLILLARKNVANAIFAGDLKTSCWYLERKCSQEFLLRYIS